MAPTSASLSPATETTPLVDSIDDLGSATSSPALSSSPIPVRPQPGARRGPICAHVLKWRVLYVTAVFAFLVDFPTFMGEAAKLRMLELGLCREHYSVVNPGVIGDDGGIAEDLCKDRDIQSALARMRGFLSLVEYIPGLTLAVPYGILADMRGRKLVLALSLLGILLSDVWLWAILYFYQSFPLRAVYSAPALVVVGGGSTVLIATSLAVVAAAMPEEKRTQAFLYLNVTILLSELLAPLIGSLLLDTIGPHATFIAAVPVLCLGFIPLTLYPSEKRIESNAVGSSPFHSHDAAEQANDTVALKGIEDRLKQRFRRAIRSLNRDIAPLLFQRSLMLGVLSLAIQKLTRPMLELVLQYMSVRFGWSLSKSALLISIQAAAQIVLFLFVLPQVYGWLLKRQDDAGMANLALARLCITFLVLGSLSMAFAPVAPIFIIAVILYTLGTGYAHAMRSFLTSLLDKDRITLLYTTMAFFEGLASLAGSPLLGLTFSAGIDIGGLAVALPFFVAAGLYALAAMGIWLIRPERRYSGL